MSGLIQRGVGPVAADIAAVLTWNSQYRKGGGAKQKLASTFVGADTIADVTIALR
jgi:hypothetical protein